MGGGRTDVFLVKIYGLMDCKEEKKHTFHKKNLTNSKIINNPDGMKDDLVKTLEKIQENLQESRFAQKEILETTRAIIKEENKRNEKNKLVRSICTDCGNYGINSGELELGCITSFKLDLCHICGEWKPVR